MRGRDYVAHGCDCSGPSLRPAGGPAGAADALRSAGRLRSSRTAARRISPPATAFRSARAAPAARSASIRQRTWARSATGAPSSRMIAALAARIRRLRNGGQTNRYVHVEARREQPSRRSAGRRAAGPAATALTLDGAAPGARGRVSPPAGGRGWPRAKSRGAAAEARDNGHVYHLFRGSLERTRRAPGASACIRRRNVDPLPGTAAASACVRLDHAARCPRASRRGDCPVAARATQEILSLPLHPRLTDTEVERVLDSGRGISEGTYSRVKALITGGAGFIGSHLAERLLKTATK